MTKASIALAAILSTCVAVGQTVGRVSPGMPSSVGADSQAGYHSNQGALASVLELNEGQLESLRQLNFEFEDQLFPLMRESWEKEWELRRLSRSKSPDESKVAMIAQDIEALYGQIHAVGVNHRQRARALLKYRQLTALGRLETALELSQAAQEAVCANLIATPGDYEYIPGLGALFGFQLGFPCGGIGLNPEFPVSFGGDVTVGGILYASPSDRPNP